MGPISRRNFVSAAVLATARGYSQVAGAGERLRIGVIGCGGMATSHMRALVKMRDTDNIDILAVCDVYDKRLEQAVKLTGAKPHKDYRRLLEDKNIDYVLIATPEHWHYQMTIDAAEAGKHIYCEKPMTQTAGQARKVVEKIQRAAVKMQVGVQGMSDDSYEAAAKHVKAGALGNVVLAQIDYSRNHLRDFWVGRADPDLKPGVNLDWKAWLGPAPKRLFEPERYLHWRRYWDYSAGIASDLFIHRVTRIIKALDLTFPERGVACGGKWEFKDSPAEVPDTFNIMLDYPGGPTVLLISSMANDAPVDHLLRGHKATLEFTRTGFVIRPQALFGKEGKEVVHRKTGGEDVTLHHRNLIRAIRLNEPLKCDCRLGYYGVVACALGVESFRRQKYVKWDQARQRILAS
ncbi:MAG: Gfo/Idh/MocA family oxidoreductase [Acidobacteriota bacterium]